jgi:hypothetical protein
MIVLQDEDARAGRHRKNLRRRGGAVADRRDQRHVLRLRLDQRRRGLPRALVLRLREVAIDRPRPPLAPDGLARGLLRAQRQRAVGRRVEVTDLARDIEDGTLRGEHADFPLFLVMRGPDPRSHADRPRMQAQSPDGLPGQARQ